LYGLEGAVRGVPSSRLDPGVKAELRAWFRMLPAMDQTVVFS